MHNAKPMFNPTTHYRIEVGGRVDVEWLQSFNTSAKISIDQAGVMEDITVLDVHADQAGIIGLVRRLHWLGMAILQFQIVSGGGEAAQVEE